MRVANVNDFKYWKFTKDFFQFHSRRRIDWSDFLLHKVNICPESCFDHSLVRKRMDEVDIDPDETKTIYEKNQYILLAFHSDYFLSNSRKSEHIYDMIWLWDTLTIDKMIKMSPHSNNTTSLGLSRYYDGYSHLRLYGLSNQFDRQIQLNQYGSAKYHSYFLNLIQIVTNHHKITQLNLFGQHFLEIIELYPIQLSLNNYFSDLDYWFWPELDIISNLLFKNLSYDNFLDITPSIDKIELDNIKLYFRGYITNIPKSTEKICVHLPNQRSFSFLNRTLISYEELGFDPNDPHWSSDQ